ncbi:MAG: transposase [Colwellia sp.]|nr:transposase [Colwellia sp.]
MPSRYPHTTNARESLNSVIRKAIKRRKLFPSDKSAKTVVYLAMDVASKKWTMLKKLKNWQLHNICYRVYF